MNRAAFLLLCVAMAHGATTGAIAGYVSDTSGGVVIGAEVTTLQSGTGARRSTISGAHGEFQFALLSPGVWSVSAKAAKFDAVDVSAVVVGVDQTVRVDIVLKLGALREAAIVSADRERITVGNVIDST